MISAIERAQDLEKVRQNIGKLVKAGAIQADIQQYIRQSGFTEQEIQAGPTAAGQAELLDTGPGEAALIGTGRGLTDVAEGAQQMVGQEPPGVMQERAMYAQTPVGQSFAGALGRFAGNVAPFAVIPAAGGAGLLGRSALGAGAGGLMGGSQYVEPGGSRLANTLMGAGFGGVTPPVLAGLRASVPAATRLAARGPTGTAVQQNIDDFARAGTTPNVGQATGNTMIQGLQNASSIVPGGVAASLKSRMAQQEAIGDRVSGLARSLGGRGLEPEKAGKTISAGLSGFSQRFREKGRDLYDAIPIDPDAPVAVQSSLDIATKLTQPIAGAEATSAVLRRSVLPLADAVKRDAAEGAMPYSALKALRTEVGDRLASGSLVDDIPRAQLKQLYGALSADMESAAATVGPKAKAAASRANTYWRSGMERIEGTLDKVAKKASPEEVYRAAMSGTKEGASKIRKVMRSLTPEERNIVSATALNRMGRVNPSKQDDVGEVFDSGTFLTNWNQFSPGAKRVLFKPVYEDMEVIARVASKMRDMDDVLINPSGTAGKLIGGGTLLAGGGAAGVGNALLPGGIAVVALTNRSAQHLLSSPKVVKWLAQSTRIKPEGRAAHIAKLATIRGSLDAVQRDAVDELEESLTN